jgi:hypothetical protein
LLNDHRLGRKEPNMMVIGVDYHPSFQTIAFLMEETGECGEQELNHSDGQAERFYRDLQQRGIRVRVPEMRRVLELDLSGFPTNQELTMKCAKFGFHPPILILADSRSAPRTPN